MESRKSQRSSSSGLGNSMRIEMNANSFPTSKAVVQKRETLPIAAEDGIIMTDLSLKPIAIDRGATAILTDIGRYENSTDLTRLPREVMAALQDTDLHHLSAFRFRVRGERQTYDCRAYLLEPRQRATVSPFLTLYFRRISSPGDAIRRLSAECNLTDRLICLFWPSASLWRSRVAANSPEAVGRGIDTLVLRVRHHPGMVDPPCIHFHRYLKVLF
jgi:hypothetical protein